MKFLALNLDFNSVSFDPLGTRNPPYEGVKFKTRFLLLSTADDRVGAVEPQPANSCSSQLWRWRSC